MLPLIRNPFYGLASYECQTMPDPQEQLRAAVTRWVPLSEAQWQALAAVFVPKTLKAREHLALPEDPTRDVLFVARGLLRFYYASEGGGESNKAFVGEGDFAGPLAAVALGLPLDYGVQALEPTTLLAASHAAFVELVGAEPAFERLSHALTERLLVHKEVRVRSLLQQSATERYLAFLSAYPDLAQRVPQYHIASYLGVTDVHLSRVRREIAGGVRSERR